MERRGHRARPAEEGRGPGQARRRGPLPLRRAHGHGRHGPADRYRRAHGHQPVPGHRRARGRGRGRGGRRGRHRPRGRRPRRLLLHPVLRQVPVLSQGAVAAVRPRGVPARGAAVHRPDRAAPQQGRQGPRHDGRPRHLRALHGRLHRLVREDRSGDPAREGCARRLRRHHRLGVIGLRRRRPTR